VPVGRKHQIKAGLLEYVYFLLSQWWDFSDKNEDNRPLTAQEKLIGGRDGAQLTQQLAVEIL
jgi:hypothetical protein